MQINKLYTICADDIHVCNKQRLFFKTPISGFAIEVLPSQRTFLHVSVSLIIYVNTKTNYLLIHTIDIYKSILTLCTIKAHLRINCLNIFRK